MKLCEATYGSWAVIDMSICRSLFEETMDVLSCTTQHFPNVSQQGEVDIQNSACYI